MDTIYITNDRWRAQVAERAGVNRIMVDLEILGKMDRQGCRDTVISRHSITDVALVRSVLKDALLMVRVNPVHPKMDDEVDACIDAGADVLMLPMFARPTEVRRFIDIVGGRARTCLLLETGAALARIHDILDVGGIDEVHIGLNDLHLSLKLDFMFEIVSGGLMEYMARILKARGKKFGFGGIARIRRSTLTPLSPELILSEHVRLGSSQVILSRDYSSIFEECPREVSIETFVNEVRKLHLCINRISAEGPGILISNFRDLKRAVDEIASDRRRSMLQAAKARADGSTDYYN